MLAAGRECLVRKKPPKPGVLESYQRTVEKRHLLSNEFAVNAGSILRRNVKKGGVT